MNVIRKTFVFVTTAALVVSFLFASAIRAQDEEREASPQDDVQKIIDGDTTMATEDQPVPASASSIYRAHRRPKSLGNRSGSSNNSLKEDEVAESKNAKGLFRVTCCAVSR